MIKTLREAGIGSTDEDERLLRDLVSSENWKENKDGREKLDYEQLAKKHGQSVEAMYQRMSRLNRRAKGRFGVLGAFVDAASKTMANLPKWVQKLSRNRRAGLLAVCLLFLGALFWISQNDQEGNDTDRISPVEASVPKAAERIGAATDALATSLAAVGQQLKPTPDITVDQREPAVTGKTRTVVENRLSTSSTGDGPFTTAFHLVLDQPGVRQQIKEWEDFHLRHLAVEQLENTLANDDEFPTPTRSFSPGDHFEDRVVPTEWRVGGRSLDAYDAVSVGQNFIAELMLMIRRARGNLDDPFINVISSDKDKARALFQHWSRVVVFRIRRIDVAEQRAALRFSALAPEEGFQQDGCVELKVIVVSGGAEVWGAEKIVLEPPRQQ